MECIDDHYEVLTGYYDKRKKGGGEYTVYKLYRCKCYLCGKEQNIKSSEFYINPPTAYGYTAYNGYYSGAKCDCHQISSFQWKVNKLLKEHRIPYRVEESFPNLFGIGKKNLLRFDFAILNIDGTIKCLIECQGGQHNYPVEEFGGIKVFVAQQKNDELKRRFADEQGIPLYEISDKNKKYEAIEAFLKSHGVID